MGKIQLKQRDFDLAQDSFESVLKLNPENEEAKAELDKILERKALREKIRSGAQKEKQVTVEDIENDIRTTLTSAIKQVERKDYEAASASFEEILALIKKIPRAASQFRM